MRIAVFGFAAALGALAMELVLRSVEPAVATVEPTVAARLKEQLVREVPYQPDADLGAVMAASVTKRIDTPEFSYTLRTDHAGFPNADPWPEQVDVVVLGNSLITGTGVGFDERFSTLLQDRLGGRSIVNLGVHGGGTDHQLRVYRKFAAPLRPRLVIASLWLVWEIDNTRKFADWLAQDPRPDFTEYRLTYGAEDRDSEQAEPSKPRDPGFVRQALRESRLVRRLREGYKRLRGIREPVERVDLGEGQFTLLSARNEERLLSGWQRPGAGDLRQRFFAPLETLRDEVEAGGGRLLVLLFPSKEELYAARDIPEILDVVATARAEIAARGLVALDLYPVFEGTLEGPPAFFLVDMHPNALGHRLTADAIAQWAEDNRVFAPYAAGLPAGGR